MGGPLTAFRGTLEVGDELRRLSGKRVFFGHQSVGASLVEGVRELVARSQGIVWPIVDSLPHRSEGGVLAHLFIGTNGEPYTKLRTFVDAVASASDASMDIALLKLCYADFNARTDVSRLFDAYEEAIRVLSKAAPHTLFAHVTVPLAAIRLSPARRALVSVIAPPARLVANAKREAFNELVRLRYGRSGAVFDLALLESTAPDGRRCSVGWGPMRVPVLCSAYTVDGGHLAGETPTIFARRFVAFLAGRTA